MPEAHCIARCLCGAVELELTLPSLWCAHCHCSMCRRAHGAPFVTWVGFPEASVRVLKAEALRRYASSADAARSFCGACGTPMLFESTRWAGEVHVARACIEGELDREPRAHVFVSDKAPWVHLGDDLPLFGGISGTERL